MVTQGVSSLESRVRRCQDGGHGQPRHPGEQQPQGQPLTIQFDDPHADEDPATDQDDPVQPLQHSGRAEVRRDRREQEQQEDAERSHGGRCRGAQPLGHPPGDSSGGRGREHQIRDTDRTAGPLHRQHRRNGEDREERLMDRESRYEEVDARVGEPDPGRRDVQEGHREGGEHGGQDDAAVRDAVNKV